MMSTYNGWTNYATWRVNLEIFDGMSARDLGADRSSEAWDFGSTLKDYAEECICSTSDEGLARDYALAFLEDVNYREIAEHMLRDTFGEDETETEDEAEEIEE